MWIKQKPLWGGLECNLFYSRVCSELKRATKREMQEVKQELSGHLQDHAEVLIERGYDPYQAELRAIETMGDPAQIGKALNKSYSRFWLICKRTLMVLFCLLLLFSFKFSLMGVFTRNMLARLPSGADLTQISNQDFTLELGEIQRLNLKMESDSTVVRLEQIAVGEMVGHPDGKSYCVSFSVSVYSKNPFDYCYFEKRLYLAEDPAGSRREMSLCSDEIGGRSSGMYYVYGVDHGTEQVEIVWERYGQDLRVQVSLDWEGVA